MRTPRIRLRSLLILIAVAAFLMAGVATALRRPGRPYSTVYAKFDPAILLASRPGYSVQGIAGWNVFNAERGYASQEWRGVVTAPNDPAVHQTIQQSIEGYLGKATEGRFDTEEPFVGGLHETPQDQRLPSHAAFLYNEREWHGNMHI